MTRYVEHILQPGETVSYEGRIHWLIYLPSWFLLLFAVGGAVLLAHDPNGDKFPPYTLIGFGVLFGGYFFLRAWMKRRTTEIAVTNRRVIYKRGFIRRTTIEMNMDKVESIDVNQSILGRIFNYGDILVRGTGSGLEPLHMIHAPIAFRNAVIAR